MQGDKLKQAIKQNVYLCVVKMNGFYFFWDAVLTFKDI